MNRSGEGLSSRAVVSLDRRQLLTALLGASVVSQSSCRPRPPEVDGEFVETGLSLGHRIRDGFRPSPTTWKKVDVVVVGGGIAGLSAGWRLRQSGIKDIVLLELASVAGGTSRSAQHNGIGYPWGAHYLTVPMRENRALIRLLREMGVVTGTDERGDPIVSETCLCREPEERLFFQGRWLAGLYPSLGASQEDRQQLQEFRAVMGKWAGQRDASGRRVFAIPIAESADLQDVNEMDRISMGDWMCRQGWTSARLRWLVDYACRDDYGLSLSETSAWAGMFYFASRMRTADEGSQSVITWPSGNGHIVHYLTQQLGQMVQTGHAVTEVIPATTTDQRIRVVAFNQEQSQAVGFEAQHVILATPQFLTQRLLPHELRRDVGDFQYGTWVVANVHLQDRPIESGFPMCWDNVIHDSKSLGYVVSTHQTGRDHGPTVLTWYHPLTDVEPSLSRQDLLKLSWSHWADVVLCDLEVAHPDIRQLVTRIDIMRWGHAMIQPRPSFIQSRARRAAARPKSGIHFAGADLSGVALMEEAFYHGVRSAEEVLADRGHAFATFF